MSKALKIIKFLAIPFSVRSGGHSPNPGFSSIDHDGVLLSMGRMGAITLSADKTIASLGPGARWGDVIDTLDALEASVVGGRIPIVGVAGLILGGQSAHQRENETESMVRYADKTPSRRATSHSL